MKRRLIKETKYFTIIEETEGFWYKALDSKIKVEITNKNYKDIILDALDNDLTLGPEILMRILLVKK